MDTSRLKGFFTARRKFSDKLPAIYLDSVRRTDNPHHLEVFFVNNSDRRLDFVASPQPLLFISSLADERVQSDTISYDDVLPGEAVKIAEFDEIFDSDFLHRLIVLWKPRHDKPREIVIVAKGTSKFAYRVLEWGDDNA